MFTSITTLLLSLVASSTFAEGRVGPLARGQSEPQARAAHVLPSKHDTIHAHYSHPRPKFITIPASSKANSRSARRLKRDSGAQATVKCLSESTFALCDEYGKCTDMGAVAAGTACVNNAITWATHDEVAADSAAVTEEYNSPPAPSASSAEPTASPAEEQKPKPTPTLMNSRPIVAAPVVNAAVSPSPSPSPSPAPVAEANTSDDEVCDDEQDEGDDTIEEWDCDAEEAAWHASATSSSDYTAPSTTAPAPVVNAVEPTTTSAWVEPPKATTTTQAPAPAATTTASSGSGASSEEFTGGKATFFYQGGAYGACGIIHQDSDYIVALEMSRYGGGSNDAPDCGRKVVVTNVANGKTVTATVADACPGCANYNSLDLSVGAFDQIAEQATGVIDIKWHFAS